MLRWAKIAKLEIFLFGNLHEWNVAITFAAMNLEDRIKEVELAPRHIVKLTNDRVSFPTASKWISRKNRTLALTLLLERLCDELALLPEEEKRSKSGDNVRGLGAKATKSVYVGDFQESVVPGLKLTNKIEPIKKSYEPQDTKKQRLKEEKAVEKSKNLIEKHESRTIHRITQA